MFAFAASAVALVDASASTLWLSTDRKRLERNGESVFLNGVNLAWISCAPHRSFSTNAEPVPFCFG